MSNTLLRHLLVGSLLVISVWNAAGSLREFYHWPVRRDDEWASLERDLVRAKVVLNDLSARHLEYRLEEASNTYDPAAFYRLQNILVPSILQSGITQNRYVLVEFWRTRRVKPVPDLVLIEDFGHGLGLYRRPS